MNIRSSVLVGLLAGVSVFTQLTPPVHSAVSMSARNRDGDRNNQDRSANRGVGRSIAPSGNRQEARPALGPQSVNRGNSYTYNSPRILQNGNNNGGGAPNLTFSGRGPTLGTPNGNSYRSDHALGTTPPSYTRLGTPNGNRPAGRVMRPSSDGRLLGTPAPAGTTYSASPNVRYDDGRGRFRRDRPGRTYNRQDADVDRDGVTQQGRILGTTRPVDRHGRTEAGRALGTPVYNYPSSSPVIDRVGGGGTPIYWYNPLNGQYERRGNRGHNRQINVLLGTAAPRPIHRFKWGGATHYVFYPYYAYNSLDYGYQVCPSPYFYYGYGASYIPSTRVIYVDRTVYLDRDRYADEGDRDYAGDADDYYLNRSVDQDVESAMTDIRKAWLDGDIDLLLRHLRSEGEIGVFLKGKYSYALPPSDYRDLTQDAMKNTTTTSFRWVGVDRRADDEVFVSAEHVFTDADGDKRTVFVSFTLVNIHGAWWVVEVGSSDQKSTL